MSSFSKLKVAVLRGGPSYGYEASLASGAHLLSILREKPERYDPQDIFISKVGEWHAGGVPRDPHDALRHVDLVWNALHGPFGEDGQVQRVLELARVPYTGASPGASALAMHKEMAKSSYAAHSLLTPAHELIRQETFSEDDLVRIFRTYLHPVVVKPANGSLGVGIMRAHTYKELQDMVGEVFSHSPRVLVEEMVRGMHASCAVVDERGGERAYALSPVEHKEDGFSLGSFTTTESAEIARMAREAHKTLGMRHYSSSDFVITPRGRVYILETNSHPRLDESSSIHRALEEDKWPKHDFVDHIVNLALKRK